MTVSPDAEQVNKSTATLILWSGWKKDELNDESHGIRPQFRIDREESYNLKTAFCECLFLFCFGLRQLAAGRSLNFASYRGSWGERCCPRSVAAIHSVAADRWPITTTPFVNVLMNLIRPHFDPLYLLPSFLLKPLQQFCWPLGHHWQPGASGLAKVESNQPDQKNWNIAPM